MLRGTNRSQDDPKASPGHGRHERETRPDGAEGRTKHLAGDGDDLDAATWSGGIAGNDSMEGKLKKRDHG